MHSLFKRPPARGNIGTITPPERNYLERSFKDILADVVEYYHHHPKRVDSDNLFGRLLTLLPRRWDLDDRRYLQLIDDVSETTSRSFNFVSPMYKGRIYEKGVTLGSESDEVIIDHHDGVPADLDTPGAWRYWQPYRYLTHTRYDLQLPVMNNHQRIKGHGVGVIDIPLMALQYRRWLKSQKHGGVDQKESVFRFIGGYVLPNTLYSYLDIAVFNRLTRIANGIPIPNVSNPHPFYVTDFSQRIDHYCKKLLEDNQRRSVDIETFVETTPLIREKKLRQLINRAPNQPITYNNEWAFIAARLNYIKYVVQHGVHESKGDRKGTNEIYERIIEVTNDRIFTGIGSSRVIQNYKEQLLYIKQTLEDKNHGWS